MRKAVLNQAIARQTPEITQEQFPLATRKAGKTGKRPPEDQSLFQDALLSEDEEVISQESQATGGISERYAQAPGETQSDALPEAPSPEQGAPAEAAQNFNSPGAATLAILSGAALLVGAAAAGGSSSGGSDAKPGSVEPKDVNAPLFTSSSTAVALNENSGAGQVVYSATATDSSSVRYSLKSGDDAAAFTIDSVSGKVRLTANPDFEQKDSYTFTVVATDAAGNASERTVTLAIADIDEIDPAFTSSTTAAALNENSGAGQVVYSATATDSSSVRYSLKSGDDAAAFTIDSVSGKVRLTANPDFEQKDSYTFTVVATDAAGNASERTVTLAIADIDEIDPAFTSSTTAVALNENSGAGQVVYSATATDSSSVRYSLKSGDDAAAFTIDSVSGKVRLTANPDFEQKDSYTFTVVATDAAGNASERTVTLAIADIDEIDPALAITDNAAGSVDGDVTFTFTFSEAVTGFGAEDVHVTNGNAGAFVRIDEKTWTLQVTPSANTTGTIGVTVDNASAADLAGNGNTAASAEQAFDTRHAPLWATVNASKIDFAQTYDWGSAILIQDDGKAIVGGYAQLESGTYDYVLARLNTDGTLDSTFGQGGKSFVDLGGWDYANALTMTSDGSLLLAGQSEGGNFAVARFDKNGALQNTFGTDGVSKIDFGISYQYCNDIVLQSNGKMVLAGTMGKDIASSYDFALTRLTADGQIDMDFGNSATGRVTLDLSKDLDWAYGVVALPNDSLIVAGRILDDFALVHLDENGNLDTAFGGKPGGVVSLDFFGRVDEIRCLAVQGEKIVVAGNAEHADGHSSFAIARFNADGTLDETFGNAGTVTADFGQYSAAANAIQVAADGSLLISGSIEGEKGSDFAVLRLSADGELDPDFGTNGLATHDSGTSSEWANDLAIQADGKVLVLGASRDDIAVIRLNTDGTPDEGFGTSAIVQPQTIWVSTNGKPLNLNDVSSLTDADAILAGNYDGSMLTIARKGGANAEDDFAGLNNLLFEDDGSLVLGTSTIGTFTESNGALALSFNAQTTQSVLNEVIHSIGYSNLNQTSLYGEIELQWTFIDNTALSTTFNQTVLYSAPL